MMPSRNALFDEAARRWLACSQDPADAAARSEINAWLTEGERHAEAWELVQRVWRISRIVGPGPLVATGARPPNRASRTAIAVAAAAMAACLVLVFGPRLWLMMGADYRAGVGESRDLVLADGSRVQLDSDSAIAADFTADGRGVTLLAGRAFFDVAPDPGRPFLVQAAGVSVTVTGTEFDVALGPQEIAVTVSEGEVAVAYANETEPSLAHLSPGDRLTVDRNGKSARSERVPLSQIAAWRRHWLMVDRATVAAVVAEIGRYRTGAVIVTDDGLAGKEVTGVFDLRDPLRALSTVVRPYDGQVREITPWLVLISSSGKSTE